jgi:hypothetical protein
MTQASFSVNQEYDGIFPTGSFGLAIAYDPPAECIWETTIDRQTILFRIDPAYFQTIAAENDCIAPEQLELQPTLIDYSPQLEHIARLYHAEMQQQSLGGRLYSESLGLLQK